MSEDTHGHCCWPAQVWSTSRATCVGIPQCPTGLQPSGESCVAPAAPPPVAAPPPPAPANPNLPRWTPVNPSGGPSPPSSSPPPPPTSVYQPVAPAPTYQPVVPVGPPPHVPVRFESRDRSDDRYRITADGKSCTTPCTLDLPSGGLHVQADTGGRSVDAPLQVPGVPAVVEVSHRSRIHYAVGGALLAVGVADVALGFWFAFGNSFDGHEAVGGVNVALGAVGAVVGIVDLALTGRARLELRAASTVGSAR